MFECSQQSVSEMETAANNYAMCYTNASVNWDLRGSQIQSWSNTAQFIMSAQKRDEVMNNNTEHIFQGYKLVKNPENFSYADFHNNLNEHGRYKKPRLQQIVTTRKRRTLFNTEQILILEKIFNKSPYLSKEEIQILKVKLNVSDRIIKAWFRNRRRLSRRTEPELALNTESSEEENDHKFDLDYVQYKIDHPNEYGYVTLDEKAMQQLMTAIDSVLTDIDLEVHYIEEFNKPSTNILDYEPISPASIHDDGNGMACFTQWQPHAPENCLRSLFDL